MAAHSNPFLRFLSALRRLFRLFRSLVLNLLFLLLVLLLIVALVGSPTPPLQPGTALLLDPAGVIVEQTSYVNPLDRALTGAAGAGVNGEVLLQDLLDAIAAARDDGRINALILATDDLSGGSLAHLQDVAAALRQFRDSGKPIYAIGGNYDQSQYLLAAQADVVMLNDFGTVALEGLSSWQPYFGSALDKLGVNVHIFRVGEYKAAPEPFARDDMSPEARENYTRLLGTLWQQYTSALESARELPTGSIDDLINRQDEWLGDTGGDSALLALEQGLVDRAEPQPASLDFLRDELGAGEDYAAIDFQQYLQHHVAQPLAPVGDRVGIVVASGTIVDGEAPRGSIGGDTLSELLLQAQEDQRIKALVLRIDSGGGSAFASEQIRTRLQAFRDTGRPVIVSMGSVAASGGYWIAMPADEIWASPGTITGSIGIYGIYPTFEDTFNELGISIDGVGTTALAGYTTAGRPLSPLAERSLQLSVDYGYRRFLDLVAAARGLNVEQVDTLARGQVWSGSEALANGLVDREGSLAEAVASAAALAGLESWQTQLIETPPSPAEQLLRQLTRNSWTQPLMTSLATLLQPRDPLTRVLGNLRQELDILLRFDDRNALYLRCFECRQLRLTKN